MEIVAETAAAAETGAAEIGAAEIGAAEIAAEISAEIAAEKKKIAATAIAAEKLCAQDFVRDRGELQATHVLQAECGHATPSLAVLQFVDLFVSLLLTNFDFFFSLIWSSGCVDRPVCTRGCVGSSWLPKPMNRPTLINVA